MPLVMKYGLLPPVFNADVVEEQLWHAHRYRNELVSVECKVRDLKRAAEDEYGIRELLGQIKDLGVEKAKLYKGKSDKDRSSKEFAEKVEAIDEKIAKLIARIKELRATPALKARMLEINGKESTGKKKTRAEAFSDKTPNNGIAARMRRQASHDSPAFWGTKLLVDKAFFESSKVPMYEGREDNNPEFKRWKGEGSLSVQIQGGKGKIPLDIFSNDHRAIIDPVDTVALTSERRCDRRRAARTTLTMAVAGTARGKSEYIVAKWPMILHRPLPPNSRITWVTVTRRRRGPDLRWSCEITVELDKQSEKPPLPAGGTVAVVLGWRAVEGNKIRVAHWLSEDGETGVFDLSRDKIVEKIECGKGCVQSPYNVESDGGRSGIFASFRRKEEISRTRDDNFNKAMKELVSWLSMIDKLPAWMRNATARDIDDEEDKSVDGTPTSKQAIARMQKWRAPRRLANLVTTWEKNRFEGDAEIYERMMAWRKQNLHLYRFEGGMHETAKRRRNNAYRNVAARLARTYSRILVDGTNFKQIVEKEKEEEKSEGEIGKRQRQKSRSNLQIVAPGIFRECIKNAARGRGVFYEKVSVENSSVRCPRCGRLEKGNKDVKAHMFSCSHCGLTRDTFHVRLLNMLNDDGKQNEVLEIIRRQEKMLAVAAE